MKSKEKVNQDDADLASKAIEIEERTAVETVQNLTFDQVFDEFKRRKKQFEKRYKKRPTGVVIGQIEGAILAKNKEVLEARNMVRVDGKQVFFNNMLAIMSEKQSCVAPFYVDMKQMDEQNPYANL